MSCTEMYRVNKAGNIRHIAEFRNAFRGAWLVWSQMGKRYLNKDAAMLMIEDGGGMQEVWDLWKSPSVPLVHRVVMASTFDKVMVQRENLPRLIEAIEEYSKTFDPGTLLLQVRKMRELALDRDTIAVCWNATSVNANPWWVGHRGDDEGRPYNINDDEGHWFLFTELVAVMVTETKEETNG